MAKILISIDERLLARIDRAAREQNESRSAYLARLADADLARRTALQRRVATAAFERLDRLFRAAGRPDAADLTLQVRAERDAR